MKKENREDVLKFLDKQILKKYGTQENFKNVIENRSYDKTIYKQLVDLENGRKAK